jgi:integrase
MEWGMRKGYVVSNPCRGVRRNTERPRTRYVADYELAGALSRAKPYLRRIMQAAYLTGLRQGDLIAMRKEQVTDEGIMVAESKRGKRVVIAWSDELRAVIDEAKAASKCERVFANYYGREWTSSGVQTAFQKLAAGFTFHDLRGKAESDHKVGLGLLSRYKRARRLTPVR